MFICKGKYANAELELLKLRPLFREQQHLKQHTQIQSILAHSLKVAILTSYKKLSVGYIELKLHIYTLGTSETYFTSCKKGHNKSPLSLNKEIVVCKLLEIKCHALDVIRPCLWNWSNLHYPSRNNVGLFCVSLSKLKKHASLSYRKKWPWDVSCLSFCCQDIQYDANVFNTPTRSGIHQFW